MVKTPKTRHSKTPREPVMIDLEPDDVKRMTDRDQPAGVEDAESSTGSISGAGKVEMKKQSEADTTASEPAALHAADDDGKDDRASAFGRSTEAEPETEEAWNHASAKRGGRSLVAAGFVGAVAVFAVLYGLRSVGWIDRPISGADPAVLETLQTEIATLKQDIEGLKAAGDGGLANDVNALSEAVKTVMADMASLRAVVESGGAGDGAGIAALDAKIREIEARIASLGQGGETVDLSAVEAKIAAVEALAKAAGDTGGALQERLAQLEQSLGSLSAKVDSQAAQPKIALAIASAALKAAIERGGPFVAEIETFAAVAPNAPELPALRQHAEAGVATRADIVAGLEPAALAMIAADQPADPDAGFFERLFDSAKSLVSVRPVGDVAGEGVPETVARMEVAVKGGDFAKAIAEFDTLPDAAKAAGDTYAKTIRARIEVETLVNQAVASAMQAA